MTEDEKNKIVEGPSTWVSMAEWLVVAMFFAVVFFGLFHFSLFTFSWMYKLSVHFHYLP